MATLARIKTNAAFPAAEVEACIRDALKVQAAEQSLLRPHVVAAAAATGSWQPAIDSLAVVEVMCSIEALLGLTLPPSFKPRGGYDNVDDCVRELLSETRSVWFALSN